MVIHFGRYGIFVWPIWYRPVRSRTERAVTTKNAGPGGPHQSTEKLSLYTSSVKYTVFRKKTPTVVFLHRLTLISINHHLKWKIIQTIGYSWRSSDSSRLFHVVRWIREICAPAAWRWWYSVAVVHDVRHVEVEQKWPENWAVWNTIHIQSHVFVCFVDFNKAFDNVSHCKLFSKLLDDNVNCVIVRLLDFW